MRVAVVGAGGMGGYFGGLLARAGEEVALIARGERLAALREVGLTVRSTEVGDFQIDVPATDDPTEVGPVDLVIFAVKTYDLDTAAEQLGPLLSRGTLVLPLQNGVDVAVRLGRYVPPQQILGGVSYVSARAEPPATVAHAGGSKLLIGELAGGSSMRAERLLGMLQAAGLDVELRSDIRLDLWEKFAHVCAAGLLVLTRLPLGTLMTYPECRALYRGLIEETLAVGRASRVSLASDAGERIFGLVSSAESSARPSQYYDLAAGRRLELESLNGTVVRLGQERGVPTPLNFTIYAGLKPYVDGPPSEPA